jgi:hypothetical protein
MGNTLARPCLCLLICLMAAAAPAQVPVGFNWSEQVNLARDSGGALLDSAATGIVIWDQDHSGLIGWSPLDPLPSGDEIVLDFADFEMNAPFGSGTFAGQFVGSWTADDNDGWTQDGEWLYLLAYVPAAYSSSGLDEYGVSTLVPITGWPNSVVSHNIVGGGPIQTAPMPVPEPGTLLLAAGGLALLLFRKN